MGEAKAGRDSADGFEWTESGKTLEAYTWEEYEELSPEKQEAFYQWFGTVEEFEAWMDSANP